MRDVAFGPERNRTRQAGVVKLRLAELSERVEEIGLPCELARFSRQLERADDDPRVRGWIAAKIDGPETTRTAVGANEKWAKTIWPGLGCTLPVQRWLLRETQGAVKNR
jgi:hypothetical protein